MCGVCGCGETDKAGHAHRHDHGMGGHSHDHSHGHSHGHDHSHDHGHDHAHDDEASQEPPLFGPGAAGFDLVTVEKSILSKNDAFAAENRSRFAEMGVLALNFVSSPGAGKTSLLVATIERLKREAAIAVIEGDQATENDANRIRATGVPAVQINTGHGCHLDAHMVGHAFEDLGLAAGGVLCIENVGNLVCPAAFDLGEAHKVAILSVTEGEDKPVKYPDMFAASDLMILAKIDLLPHLDFDVEACIDAARRVNPAIEVIRLSSRSGEGMGEWLDWLRRARERVALEGLGTIAEPAVRAAAGA